MTAAQLKKEAKRLEKLEKFKAKQAKLEAEKAKKAEQNKDGVAEVGNKYFQNFSGTEYSYQKSSSSGCHSRNQYFWIFLLHIFRKMYNKTQLIPLLSEINISIIN